MRTGIDPPFVKSLVAALVTIHRRVERGELGSGTPSDASTSSPLDLVPSAVDPDTGSVPRSTDRYAADGGDDRLTTRDTDEGIMVVVDLRGVARNDHETVVDASGGSLVLTLDKRFAWRVPVEGDPTSITDVSVNNDVLEVRVRLDR